MLAVWPWASHFISPKPLFLWKAVERVRMHHRRRLAEWVFFVPLPFFHPLPALSLLKDWFYFGISWGYYLLIFRSLPHSPVAGHQVRDTLTALNDLLVIDRAAYVCCRWSVQKPLCCLPRQPRSLSRSWLFEPGSTRRITSDGLCR